MTKLISEPSQGSDGRWYVEGEYHTSSYATEAEAREVARSYDAAVRARKSVTPVTPPDKARV